MTDTAPGIETKYVFEQLEAGAIAITCTPRLSRHLLERFAVDKLNQDQKVWRTPHTYGWDEWLLAEWTKQARIHPDLGKTIILEDQQEAQLWESVIRRGLQRHTDVSLLQTSATARAAKQTWRLMHDWQIPLDYLAQTYVEDTQAFFDWASEFSALVRSNDWVCACQVASLLQQQAETGSWLPHGRFLLIGFDEWLPCQQSLLHTLEQAGCSTEKIAQPDINQHAEIFSCVDRRGEFEAAAEWSRHLLRSGEAGPIGIIVDDLRNHRNDVEVIFDQALHPTESLGFAEDRRRAFHVSLGRPLTEYTIVADALMLLKFMIGARSIDEVTRLLHSPFLSGGLAESSPRSTLDLWLRQRGWEQVTLQGLLKFADGKQLPVDHLRRVLRQAVRVEVKGSRAPSRWAEIFVEWLTLFGWPGERVLDSTEYQTVEAWREMLARFARLSMVTPELGCDQAINRLTYMTQRRVFQSRSEPAPVQIMGVLEASGMVFSHLWVTGASEDSWPATPLLDPFLPYEVQRKYQMPGAVAKHELARSAQTAKRIMGSAEQVVVSFPRRRDDQSLRLSPVFGDLPDSQGRIGPVDLTTYIQQAKPELEVVDADDGPAYDGSPLSGGVSIFKDQAACPFKGFTRHRLLAQARPPVEPGLTPAERGILIHDCMAEFWRETGNADKLKAMPDDELKKRLAEYVDHAAAKFSRYDKSAFHQAVMSIERDRVLTLLMEWLRVERARGGFEVREIEQKIRTDFSGLDVSVRIDRIDRLADGSRVVIDYKTGRDVSVEQWLGDRPDDPQLPLYLLSAADESNALAFAQIRKGESAFKGLTMSGDIAAGINEYEDWDGLLRDWKRVLTELAGQFNAGHARVDPKDGKVCQRCDFMSICRIFDAGQKE